MSANEIISELRNGFNTGLLSTLNDRLEALHSIKRLIEENEDSICDALYKDLHKGRCESIMSEICTTKAELAFAIKNLANWMKDEQVGKSFVTLMDTTYIQSQPLGVVLVFGAWNYPFSLCLTPVIGALAAGNSVLLKPSHLAVATEELLAKLVSKYFNKGVLQVYCGNASRSALLLEERVDHIFYTGGSVVARLVMTAAAKHLTPVTLELGGKSPAYVDKSCYMDMTARRIVWGKFMNAGQTCVAPDYILCHVSVLEDLKKALCEQIKNFYGEDIAASKNYGRIINDRHFHRLNDLLKATKGSVIYGGETNEADLFISPTLVLAKKDDCLMMEEIFGPILPIISVNDVDETIDFINTKEKPLALYAFTNDASVFDQFKMRTSSGGLLQNDCVIHVGVTGVPFGGVGQSGFGRYHGKYSFDNFSHKRTNMLKTTSEQTDYMFRYPPYNDKKESWIRWALTVSHKNSYCAIM